MLLSSVPREAGDLASFSENLSTEALVGASDIDLFVLTPRPGWRQTSAPPTVAAAVLIVASANGPALRRSAEPARGLAHRRQLDPPRLDLDRCGGATAQ
jgi:hypothetical protein